MIFLKDIGQIVSNGPAIWFLGDADLLVLEDIVPEKYHFYLKLNPIYYIIQGYRDCFVNNVWFWDRPVYTLYYWVFAGVLFVTGAVVFNRLRPHFADVL